MAKPIPIVEGFSKGEPDRLRVIDISPFDELGLGLQLCLCDQDPPSDGSDDPGHG